MKKAFLVLILLIGISFILLSKNSIENNLISPLSSELPVGLKKRPLPQSIFSAWIPWWSEKKAIQSLQKSSNKIKIISPVWYEIKQNAFISEISSEHKQQITDIATSSGILIIPTIANAIANDFDGKRVSLFLNDNQVMINEINKLIKIAKDFGYYGWDLDWEKIYKSDRDKFSDFVEYFANELHKNNLFLVVTVHAQTGSPDDWEGSKGQDWFRLSRQADFIRIMAYDFHHSESEPGPITPIDQLQLVINYANKVIPSEKIILGLPTYGYDWGRDKGEPLQYEEIITRINNKNGSLLRDNNSYELVGNYTEGGVRHTIWFEDKVSVQKKVDLARSQGIYQFCFWSLGGEGR